MEREQRGDLCNRPSHYLLCRVGLYDERTAQPLIAGHQARRGEGERDRGGLGCKEPPMFLLLASHEVESLGTG